MGFLLALIPAIAWGSIGLVSGKLGGNAYQQTLGMTFGALVFGIGTLIVMRPVLDTKIWLLGIVSGLFWALGQGQQFQSMKYMGVSMTMPISTGMQLVATTLAGALLFHEWRNGRDLGHSCAGIADCGRNVDIKARTNRRLHNTKWRCKGAANLIDIDSWVCGLHDYCQRWASWRFGRCDATIHRHDYWCVINGHWPSAIC